MIFDSALGLWILPQANTCKGFALFYPPATGDDGQQLEEALQLLEIGVASLLIEPPYRKESYLFYKQDPSAEIRMREETVIQAKQLFAGCTKGLERIHVQECLTQLFNDRIPITIIGKNLGGSIAALVCANLETASRPRELTALIVTGAIPRLSKFWQTSMHPVAQEVRAKITAAQNQQLVEALRPYDLTELLPELVTPVFVQFGLEDPWIDKATANSLHGCESITVSWTGDGHAMHSIESRLGRREFLKSRFKLGD